MNEKPETFTYGGNDYRVIIEKLIIPGIGERTRLEILVDEKAQAALVNSKSGFIKKVL